MPKTVRKTPHSKRFTAAAATINKDTFYELNEAITLVKKCASTKFNETVDLSIRLGIDTRKSDQNVRGITTLPHGTGKVRKIAVLAKGDHAKEAEAAGADTVGDEDLIKKIQEGFKAFDVILSTEEMAPQLGKVGKILGAKTPNKRNGTVTNQIGQAVKEIKAATRVEYRADKGGVINMPIGKASYSEDQLIENFTAALNAVGKAKPSSSKGKYLVTLTLSSTMGPAIQLEVAVTAKTAGVH